MPATTARKGFYFFAEHVFSLFHPSPVLPEKKTPFLHRYCPSRKRNLAAGDATHFLSPPPQPNLVSKRMGGNLEAGAFSLSIFFGCKRFAFQRTVASKARINFWSENPPPSPTRENYRRLPLESSFFLFFASALNGDGGGTVLGIIFYGCIATPQAGISLTPSVCLSDLFFPLEEEGISARIYPSSFLRSCRRRKGKGMLVSANTKILLFLPLFRVMPIICVRATVPFSFFSNSPNTPPPPFLSLYILCSPAPCLGALIQIIIHFRKVMFQHHKRMWQVLMQPLFSVSGGNWFIPFFFSSHDSEFFMRTQVEFSTALQICFRQGKGRYVAVSRYEGEEEKRIPGFM